MICWFALQPYYFPKTGKIFVSYRKIGFLLVMDLPAEGQAKRRRRAEISVTISIMQCNSKLTRKTRGFPSDCACLAVAGDAFLTISYIRLMFKLAQNHVDFKLYCILHRLFSTVISGASCLLSASLNFSLCSIFFEKYKIRSWSKNCFSKIV